MGNDEPGKLQQGFTSSLSIESLDDVARAAKMVFQSGAFGNLDNPQEAGAKIMTGLELGLSPMTAIRNIYFFDGAVTLSGPLLAHLIREHPDYDYEILGANAQGAKVRFYRREIVDGEPRMVPQEPDVQFTKSMAEKAGLFGKKNWKKYPEDMYVWRCIARGKRWHCPNVGMGSLYIKDEVESGSVEDVEPIEEVKRDEDESGPEALPENAENIEGAPDFDEKKETTETKVEPKKPEDTSPPQKKAKPLKPDAAPDPGQGDTGKDMPPQQPTEKRTAPDNVPSNGEDTGASGQTEDKAERRKALLPDYVVESDAVNIGLMGDRAVHKAREIHQILSKTRKGNDLLTTIQDFREDVSEDFSDKASVDRTALDMVLDEHLNRIGTGPANVEEPSEKPEETEDEENDESGLSVPDMPDEQPEPIAENVSVPGMPWFDTVNQQFRADMEKTRDVLLKEVAKRGITPIETRLKEFQERFENAGPTGQMEEAYNEAIAPFRTILSMRQALIDGDNPEINVFNRAINDFLETVEEFDNENRKIRAERIVFREAKRLEDRFESLTLEFIEDDEDPSGESAEDGAEDEEDWDDPVPDIPLPPGFPKRDKLFNAEVERTGEVARRIRAETLDEIKGIGPSSVDKIGEFLREIADVGEDVDLGF